MVLMTLLNEVIFGFISKIFVSSAGLFHHKETWPGWSLSCSVCDLHWCCLKSSQGCWGCKMCSNFGAKCQDLLSEENSWGPANPRRMRMLLEWPFPAQGHGTDCRESRWSLSCSQMSQQCPQTPDTNLCFYLCWMQQNPPRRNKEPGLLHLTRFRQSLAFWAKVLCVRLAWKGVSTREKQI